MAILPFLSVEGCPKCWQSFDIQHGQSPSARHHAVHGAPGWLICECPRCGYRWEEKPMDAEDPAPKDSGPYQPRKIRKLWK